MMIHKQRYFKFLILLALVLLSAPINTYAASSGAGEWSISTIKSPVGVSESFDGRTPSIAVDSDRNAHVIYDDVYFEGESMRYPLYYATKASGSTTWSISQIGGMEEGMFASIAVDLEKNVHISYTDPIGNLKYAMKPAGSPTWSISQVNTEKGMYTSIAVDLKKDVHISYTDSAGYFKYAKKTFGSSTWTIQQIGTIQEAQYTSIAVDSKGTVHIAYYFPISGELKHASKGIYDTSFITETIDNVGIVGLYPSIAIDPEDNVHISYYDADNGDLKYATNTGGSWSKEAVDVGTAGGDVGRYTSIAVDTLNRVYISYQDVTKGFLNYAVGKAGSWDNYTIDDSGNTGFATSIALDSSNMVYISYFHEDTINGDLDLMYASNGFPLTVTKSGAGNGAVVSDPSGINCGTSCSYALQEYPGGTQVRLVATAVFGIIVCRVVWCMFRYRSL